MRAGFFFFGFNGVLSAKKVCAIGGGLYSFVVKVMITGDTCHSRKSLSRCLSGMQYKDGNGKGESVVAKDLNGLGKAVAMIATEELRL